MTINEHDNYYRTVGAIEIDEIVTVTVTMTIIEDIYLDCSIVHGATLCTTASTSIQSGHPEPTSTQGYGS
jgi:hypothetical protein